MQQLISHLLNICEIVYRQNAFVYICSQIVLMLYYNASHCLFTDGLYPNRGRQDIRGRPGGQGDHFGRLFT